MPWSVLCLMLVAAALTLPPGFALAFTCGTPGGWTPDCTCPPAFVKECRPHQKGGLRCLCRDPGWSGVNPGGKAELHKKNVPTVKPGGGPTNAYWQTSRQPRMHAAPSFRYQTQHLRRQVR